MTVVQVYDMLAEPGQRDALGMALSSLAERVGRCPGCLAVDVLYPTGESDAVAMIEYWRVDSDRIAAGAALGREAFSTIRVLARDINVVKGSADGPGTSTNAARWWRRPFHIVAIDHRSQFPDIDRNDSR